MRDEGELRVHGLYAYFDRSAWSSAIRLILQTARRAQKQELHNELISQMMFMR